MATGVLLLAIGQATRLVEFSHGLPKSYEADFKMGCSSDTLDTDGRVETLEQAPEISEAEYLAAASRWLGEQEQVPPRFSALHVDGRRAHELARRGENFQLPSRKIVIHELKMLRYEYPCVTLAIRCSSGTYIRSLGSDIAISLGSDAVMTRLVRTAIGSVKLEDCLPPDDFCDEQTIARHLKPACLLTESLPKCVLSTAGCQKIRNGIAVQLPDFLEVPSLPQAEVQQATPRDLAWVAFDAAGEVVAILKQAAGGYRSLRVFHKAKDTTQPNKIKTPHKPES